MAIKNFMHIITVHAKHGYHQIKVRKRDVEKLCNEKKVGFTVMPFSIVNATSFYTCMMRTFKIEWDKLFVERMTDIVVFGALLNKSKVTISGTDIMVNSIKIKSGTNQLLMIN